MKITLLFLLLSFGSYAQVTSSSMTKADVMDINKAYQANDKTVSEKMRLLYPINNIGGVEYVSFLAKVNGGFDANEYSSRGINVGSRIGDIISLRYPINTLNEIFQESDLAYIKTAAKVKPTLDRVAVGTHADSVWAGINLPQGYTGKDVIIGITDWGFDYTSPMFYDTLLQNSRILAAWDQFKTSGPAPVGYAYGAEYATFSDLQNAESDTANFYGYHTHGNHVAGIAGGSGAGLEYRGMAFESEFLFVTFRFDESFVLDAWQWMIDNAAAQGKNLIINMSWGIYHMGALDGTDILADALDTYSSQGTLFVTSAGNNGTRDFHILKDFSAADTITTRLAFETNTGINGHWGQSVHLWGEPGNEFSCQLLIADGSQSIVANSPWFNSPTAASYLDTFVVLPSTDTIFYNITTDASYPSNGRPHQRLRVKYKNIPYNMIVRATAPSGSVHFWNLTELSTEVGNWGQDFIAWGTNTMSGDNLYGIGTPASANSTITVGAYSSEFYSGGGTLLGGAGAGFSSNGPLMNGNLKPDISAPGVNVASSISSFTDASYSAIDQVDFNGRTYPFARFSGTSMSGPACSGVAALIWEANPLLTPAQIKNVIIQTARTDNYTGVIPPHSVKWGWGKLDAYGAVYWATGIIGLSTNESISSWTVSPNPTASELNINGLSGEVTDIRVIDLTGKTLSIHDSAININVSNLEAGSYFLRVIVDGKIEQMKFTKM